MSDRAFGEHIREALAICRKSADARHAERAKRPPLTVTQAAIALVQKLDGPDVSRGWDYEEELEDLRKALTADERRVQDFRNQLTQSGGTMQSDPNVKYEVWN